MNSVDLRHAKEHLEELIERARRGEDVRIADAKGGCRASLARLRARSDGSARPGHDAAVRAAEGAAGAGEADRQDPSPPMAFSIQ